MTLPRTLSQRLQYILIRLALPVVFLAVCAALFIKRDTATLLLASPQPSVAYRPDPKYPLRFSVLLNLLPPDTTEDNHVLVQLQQLQYTAAPQAPAQDLGSTIDVCITAIWLTQVARDPAQNIPTQTAAHEFTGTTQGPCGHNPQGGVLDFTGGDFDGTNTFVAANSPNFFIYPFDGFTLEFYVAIYYNLVDRSKPLASQLVTSLTDEPVEFNFTNSSQHWQFNVERAFFPYQSQGATYNNFDFIHLDFQRPSIYQNTAIPLVALIVLVMLLLSVFQNRTLFWTSIFVLAAGVLGLRQFMLSDFIKVPTAWDWMALGLFGYIGASTALFLVRHRSGKASGPTDAPFVATRLTKIVHAAACGQVRAISRRNRVEFETLDDAFHSGFKPCPDCLKSARPLPKTRV